VTNAVGALGAINGIAGSFAEHVPVILIAGSIPLRSIERGLGMHHSMADGTWDRFLGAMAQVTAGHDGSAKLTQAAYWETLQGYLRPGDVLLTDNATTASQ
jgi:TPP-dependent 2-oxoacid decarboxylase